MNIQIISDLHLDYNVNIPFNRFFIPSADYLIIAGDLCSSSYYGTNEFLAIYKDAFKKIIYIPGNHEYYGNTFEDSTFIFKHEFDNVIYTNNHTIIIDDVRFICTTLWSGADFMVTSMINDYRQIRCFDIVVENEAHKYSVDWLNEELSKPFSGTTIIVSHHLPLYEVVSLRYKGNKINSAFVSNQSALFRNHKIDYWIHGHSHDSNITNFGDSKIIRNAFGYGKENILLFDSKFKIEI